MKRCFFSPAACLMTALLMFFSPRAMAAGDDAGAIAGVVSTFYKNYIAATLKAFTGKVDYDFRQQPELDAVFVQKIDALIKEAEDDVLGYDPILMAQDVPTGMRYGKPAVNGDLAELIAYKLWDGGSESALCVSLAKKDKAWRIIDVIDMEEAEKTQKCGGIETAAPK
jgi:hypothetical protein